MTLEITTRSDAGYASTSTIRAFSLEIDPAGEDAPDTLESLLAAYAACYVPALRVGAERAGIDDLGAVEIDATGTLNDDDKLESVTFDIATESGLDADDASAAVERANRLCKVHDALKGDLEAAVTVDGHAVA